MSKKIRSKWKPYTITYIKEHESDNLGIYEIANQNKQTLDYGQGKVRTRLIDQNPNNAHTNKETVWTGKFYRSQYTRSKLSSKQRERGLQKRYKKEHKGKLPPKNKRLGDL
ncbi:MAG: hypothetical protein EPN82_05670 [Bacteroidetes bacterium]|nr:MAG: hypothetical protein EPN82_05670 [Bacteroidota bacterium]